MKIIVTLLFLMLPMTVTAQNQGMSGNSMEKMMGLMQEMEQCMAKVDQTALEAFEKESEKISDELEVLCNKGNRKKAQKKAIAFGKKAMRNPALVQMQKCGELAKGLIPEQAEPTIKDTFDFSNRHVCDE